MLVWPATRRNFFDASITAVAVQRTHAHCRQRFVEPFLDGSGCARMVGSQRALQVLQQPPSMYDIVAAVRLPHRRAHRRAHVLGELVPHVANLMNLAALDSSTTAEYVDDRFVQRFGALKPLLHACLGDETLRLALEDWEIWLRWLDAYRAGVVAAATHPALPEERARHDQIAPIVTARLAALEGAPIRARAVFRPTPGHPDAGGGRWMEVKWTVVE